jgi:catechol 2,3-dioxygenase-like lactoylglutathione lyase family enzyme
MPTVSVRYIVHNVDAAIAFYCGHLGFSEVMHPAPGFAMLVRDDLRLLLSAPGGGPGGGAQVGEVMPTPGGWNRFTLEVADVAAEHKRLEATGVTCRSGVIEGVGGKQVLIEDPSGNPVELFEPTRDVAKLDHG